MIDGDGHGTSLTAELVGDDHAVPATVQGRAMSPESFRQKLRRDRELYGSVYAATLRTLIGTPGFEPGTPATQRRKGTVPWGSATSRRAP